MVKKTSNQCCEYQYPETSFDSKPSDSTFTFFNRCNKACPECRGGFGSYCKYEHGHTGQHLCDNGHTW